MNELKIYSISDAYISYLQKHNSNVYSNKIEHRTHMRKYLGVVIQVENYHYYIPMSSPKRTDYQKAGDGYVIKKSIIPIMRMVIRNTKGEKELKGTLRLSHMIPVPESEIELYDIVNEKDKEYKDLVQNEVIFIRKHADKIMANAKLLYKQKEMGDQTASYVGAVLDYKALEILCDAYIKMKEDG